MVVAFSGGADSAFLAWVAADTLGGDRVVAATAVSPSLAPSELADCEALAREWGLRWLPVETRELDRPDYVANGGDRCYHCKAELLDALAPAGRRPGSDRGARRQPGRPGRPPARPGGGGRAGRPVPAGRERLHQGRRARGVAPAGPADLGQAGGGLPGVAAALRHAGDRRPAASVAAAEEGLRRPGLRPAAGAPLRRPGPHRAARRGPGGRGRSAR